MKVVPNYFIVIRHGTIHNQHCRPSTTLQHHHFISPKLTLSSDAFFTYLPSYNQPPILSSVCKHPQLHFNSLTKLDSLIGSLRPSLPTPTLTHGPTNFPTLQQLSYLKDGYLNFSDLRLQTSNSSSSSTQTTPTPPKYNVKIQKTYEILRDHLPKLFAEQHPFQIYHDDVVFENNIKGYTLNGKSRYFMYIYWTRISSHFKYAKIQFNILKITLHEDTQTIKVRWQLRGVSNTNAFFKLWKLKNRFDVVKDGFSTFHLNSEGLITRHIMDKLMPDDDCKPVANLKPSVLSAKLAVLIGLLVPHIYWPDE